MNFLAHLHLSGDNRMLQLGNFLGDFVKANDYDNYDVELRKGILLHRAIDSFTDTHNLTKLFREPFRETHRHYTGVVTDVYMDYFLASDWQKYHHESIETFSEAFYETALSRLPELPAKVQRIIPVMKEKDWLSSYAHLEGISVVLSQMDRRTGYKGNLAGSVSILIAHKTELKQIFTEFYAELQIFAKTWLVKI